MIKKYIVLSTLIMGLLFNGSGVALADHAAPKAQPSFMASLWSNFKSKVSLVIKSIYAPFYSPPIQLQGNPSATDGNAIQKVNTGQNVQGLTIPGKFGFGGAAQPTPQPGTVPSAEKPKFAPVLKKLDTVVGPGAATKPIPIAPTSQPTPFKPVVAPASAPIPVPSAPQVKVLELVVTAVSNMIAAPVKEGSQIQFLANLKLSNGTFKDVSRSVRWNVVGDIGAIDTNGLFTARLGMSVSEYGEGSGAVTATYAGPEGTFLGKSAIFKVYGASGTEGDIGGQ
jgi:hypothetical protein